MRQKRSFLSHTVTGSETLKNLASQTLGKTRFDFVTFLTASRAADIHPHCSIPQDGLKPAIRGVGWDD